MAYNKVRINTPPEARRYVKDREDQDIAEKDNIEKRVRND